MLDTVRNLITVNNLVGVAAGQRVNTVGSRALLFTDFGFEAVAALTVEFEIEAQRLARIADSRIQLYLNSAVGSNVATDSTENFKTYSGTLKDYWRCSVDVSQPNFGIIVDFAPRADIPSSNPLILRSVRMRIGY